MKIKELDFSPENCPHKHSIKTQAENTEIVALRGEGAYGVETSFTCPVREKLVIFRIDGRDIPPTHSCESLGYACRLKPQIKVCN